MLLQEFQTVVAAVALRKESSPALPGSVFRVFGVPRRTLSLRRPRVDGRLAPHLFARLGGLRERVKETRNIFGCTTLAFF